MSTRRRRRSGRQAKSKHEREEEEEDILLKRHKNGSLLSWRMRRPIPDSIESVQFHRIARVLHLDEALEIQEDGYMDPKPISDFSAFHPSNLPEDHPCKDLEVLWFSPQEHADTNSTYGNVEFSLSIRWVLHKFKKRYYLENVSYQNVTLFRVLLTNTDYDKLFKKYDRKRRNSAGGPRLLPLDEDHPFNPWASSGPVHTVRKDYPRYNGEGVNRQGLVLEFLLEVTDDDAWEIVRNSRIRARNHLPPEEDEEDEIWCHKYARRNQECDYEYDRFEIDSLVKQLKTNLSM